MFTWSKRTAIAVGVGLAGALFTLPAAAQSEYGLGRAATDTEVEAWDIDVRPDFKGLPKGQGTVDDGEELWESTCASCHGSFAESNSFFTPLIGGTTEEDIKTGRVESLTSPTQTSRTIIMTVPTVSTLWDYIYRAMPWDNPRTLEPDQVYSVLAYLLSLADIVDFDFTLSDENIAEVQDRMPNRNGVQFWEGLWNVDGEPDTSNTACMEDCVEEIEMSSELPERARDAHGDLAEQMRIVGPVRGVNSLEPALQGTVEDNADNVREYARATLDSADDEKGDSNSDEIVARLDENGCMACHAIDTKKVGPAFVDVGKKYDGEDMHDTLVKNVREGSSGTWGSAPMPPNPKVSDDDLDMIIDWVLSGAPE